MDKNNLDFIKNFKVDKEEIINHWLNNESFCKILVLIYQDLLEFPSTYIQKLADNSGVCYTTVRNICHQMRSFGWLEWRDDSAIVIYPVRNSNNLIIEKYLDKAINTTKQFQKLKESKK